MYFFLRTPCIGDLSWFSHMDCIFDFIIEIAVYSRFCTALKIVTATYELDYFTNVGHDLVVVEGLEFRDDPA